MKTRKATHTFLFLAGLLMLNACSSAVKDVAKKDGVDRRFVIERSWARQTARQDFLGARLNHVSEPVLFNHLVIQGNEIDGIVAYHQKWGRKVWSRQFSGGVTSTPREQKGVLYFGAGDGFFYALDAATGKTKWSAPIKSEGLGTPLVTDEAVYFLSGNNAALALKSDNGEQIWFYSRQDSANITVRGASEPTLVGNRLYAGFSDGYLVALDKDKGGLVWEKQISQNARFRDVDAKPVVDGERIYISSYDGQLHCLSTKDGQTLWVNDEGGFTPVTIVGEQIFYSTSTRKLLALEKTSGKLIWERTLNQSVAGQPLVHRGLVIVGEWSGALRAFESTTGNDVTEFTTGRGVTSRPVLDTKTDYLYVMTADANLFALRLKLKELAGVWPWEN